MSEALRAEEVLEAIAAAEAEGATDDLEGGVPLPELADRVDRTPRSKRLRSLLEYLTDDGRVAVVHGVNPETGYSRQSYVLTDEGRAAVDGDDQEPDNH